MRWCWPRRTWPACTRAFTIGGAQAVAALAYGTATVPRVDKITGPGNAYVASAKRRVFGEVGIDMIAGPSEILVLADGSTPADWVAMDLFCAGRARRTGAKHPAVSRCRLHRRGARRHRAPAAHAAATRNHSRLPRGPRRADPDARRWRKPAHSATASRPSISRCRAPIPQRWEPLLRHAGAIFLGAFTSESLGDYCAGPNHVLPTSGTARFSSPLGVYDFQKRSSLIEVSEAGANILGPIAAELALWRGPAGPCPGRGDATRTARWLAATDGQWRSACARGRDKAMNVTPLAERVARTIRQDVQSAAGYAIQPSAGMVKLDAMENPFGLPPALQRELGERLGRAALNRYPLGKRRRGGGAGQALRRARRLSRDARQRLGRADRPAGGGLRRARRRGAGAAAGFRDVRDVGAPAGAEVRRRAVDCRASSSTRRRCWRRSSASGRR